MKKYDKYKIKSNNYVKTFFFGLVILSSAFIFRTQLINDTDLKGEETDLIKKIDTDFDEKELIEELENYLTEGLTFANYKGMYQSENVNNNLNDEEMLYIAYKYISKVTPLKNYKEKIGENTINSFINKKILSNTVYKIFGKNITNYSSFFIDEHNICEYINEEYVCSYENTENNTYEIKKEIEDYAIYNDRIVIVEKYIYRDYFLNEMYTKKYISTFVLKENNYYWDNTKLA